MPELRFHPAGTKQAASKRSLQHGKTEAHARQREERAEQMAAMREKGATLREIGLRFRLSATGVKKVLDSR